MMGTQGDLGHDSHFLEKATIHFQFHRGNLILCVDPASAISYNPTIFIPVHSIEAYKTPCKLGLFIKITSTQKLRGLTQAPAPEPSDPSHYAMPPLPSHRRNSKASSPLSSSSTNTVL